ncbi:hypothetical protein [Flavobacterium sp.]|uniref:hypothetical protein n=1 Tax=Flavobacterium sp. TaxID=239 RepID=UPI00286B325C|nr:hypothetical protein [Flavobacterium sp.]
MKLKYIYITAMLAVVFLLIWEQTQTKPTIWIQIPAIIIFFIGMSKLSAKTPSKNQEKEE